MISFLPNLPLFLWLFLVSGFTAYSVLIPKLQHFNTLLLWNRFIINISPIRINITTSQHNNSLAMSKRHTRMLKRSTDRSTCSITDSRNHLLINTQENRKIQPMDFFFNKSTFDHTLPGNFCQNRIPSLQFIQS